MDQDPHPHPHPQGAAGLRTWWWFTDGEPLSGKRSEDLLR